MKPAVKKIEYVAEISGNHLGSVSRAKELIKAAAVSGATAVKFQTYTADTMTLNLESFKVSSGHKLWGVENFTIYIKSHIPLGNGMPNYLNCVEV